MKSYEILLDDGILQGGRLSGNVEIDARDSIINKIIIEYAILEIKAENTEFLDVEFYNVTSESLFTSGATFYKCTFHVVDINPNVDYSAICTHCNFILDRDQEFVLDWDIMWGKSNRVCDSFGTCRGRN